MKCNDWECPFNKEGKCSWSDPNKDAPCFEEVLKDLQKNKKALDK
jgi:hypothetical protein